MLFVTFGLQLASISSILGQQATGPDLFLDDSFLRSRYETAFNTGILFSPVGKARNRPTVNYTITEVQLGYMLNDVQEAGWFRGNFELAGDAFGGGVFDGTGSYAAGWTLWLRYNFVPSHSRFTPYTQVGAGFVFTDIDRRLVGQDFNFNLDVGLGMRYSLDAHWALNLELRYQHISNANLGQHNIGINALGPILGISYFF